MKFPRKTIFMLIRVRLWTTRGKLSILFVSWVNQPTQLCFEISKLNTMKKVWPECWRLCRKPTKLTSFLTFRQCTGRWIPIKLAVIISKIWVVVLDHIPMSSAIPKSFDWQRRQCIYTFEPQDFESENRLSYLDCGGWKWFQIGLRWSYKFWNIYLVFTWTAEFQSLLWLVLGFNSLVCRRADHDANQEISRIV